MLGKWWLSYFKSYFSLSNSIGPVLALWFVYLSGTVCPTDAGEAPVAWIIAYGCLGIVLGLWILGRRVIETVGEDIAEITPARGFSIDLMAGLTVLLGSNMGIPLSTTHCKVGAVVSVSLMHNRNAVSWRTFGNIAWAWIVTLPVSGLKDFKLTSQYLCPLPRCNFGPLLLDTDDICGAGESGGARDDV